MIALLLALACKPTPEAPPRVAEPTPAVEAPTEAPAEAPDRVVARHILIAYDGAKSAPLKPLPSRDEAKEIAEGLRQRILAGEDMATLAKAHSDDTSKARGGFLGSASRGSWVGPFEDAVFALPVGGLSEVVESPFGFHIIRREPLDEVRLRHIVVQYKGALAVAPRSPAAARSRAEAEARVAEARARLAQGEPFEQVVTEYSDGPMGKRGGDLGWFLRGELGPAFDAVVFELPVGGVSDVVETPFGLHIVERLE